MSLTDVLKTDIAHFSDLQRSATGDLDLVSGLANLKNALLHRLVTVPGSLVHRPEYGVGIPLYQGRINSYSTQREIALRIQEQFARDSRVQSVAGVLFEVNQASPDKLKIIVRVVAIGYDEATMSFTPFAEGI